MKNLIIVVVAILSLTGADDEWKPVLDTEGMLKVRYDCKDQLGITDEAYKPIQMMHHPDERLFHDYVLCVYKGFGIFIDGKGFDDDRLLLQLSGTFKDAVITKEMFEHCMHLKEYEKEPAKLAFYAHLCLLKTPIGDLIGEGRKKGLC